MPPSLPLARGAMIPAHILRLRTATHTLSATTGRAEESAREPEGPAQPHAASHCHLHATAHCQRMKQRKDDGKPTPQVREASKHQACSSGRSFWVCLALRGRGPWAGGGLCAGCRKLSLAVRDSRTFYVSRSLESTWRFSGYVSLSFSSRGGRRSGAGAVAESERTQSMAMAP